jgi:AraC family transcriptional activator of tynA and feaB
MYERWSTLHIEAPRRAEFWREATAQSFLPMSPRLDRLDDFRAVMVHRSIDHLSLNEVRAPSHGMARTHSDLAHGGQQYIFLNLYLRGRSRVSQAGLSAEVANGRLLMFCSDSAFELEQPDPIELLSLAVPQELLQHEFDLGACSPLLIAESAPALLLASQMRALADWQEDLSQANATPISDCLIGILRAALPSAISGADPSTGHRFLRRGIRQLVERRYADPGFSAKRAADELGISVRTLHAWLARDGQTFGACLMDYRLQRAHAILGIVSSEVHLIEVALQCGFLSAAHFTRSFKARYGLPPSGFRKQALLR